MRFLVGYMELLLASGCALRFESQLRSSEASWLAMVANCYFALSLGVSGISLVRRVSEHVTAPIAFHER